MKTLENIKEAKRIIVWDKRQVGWIDRKKVGFFRKKDVIQFVSTVAGFWDCTFKSEKKLQEFISDNNLMLYYSIVWEKWSIDIIYSYKCSRTIYFSSKKSQDDWLKEHCGENYIHIENDELV